MQEYFINSAYADALALLGLLHIFLDQELDGSAILSILNGMYVWRFPEGSFDYIPSVLHAEENQSIIY